MDIVLTFDPNTKEYKFYEPTTDTLLLSGSLGEGFVSLDLFLTRYTGKGLMAATDTKYHIDSGCFQQIVKSNVDLLRRLNSGPSEFKSSTDKFGGSTGGGGGTSSFARSSLGATGKDNFGKSRFGGSKSGFNKSNKKWIK